MKWQGNYQSLFTIVNKCYHWCIPHRYKNFFFVVVCLCIRALVAGSRSQMCKLDLGAMKGSPLEIYGLYSYLSEIIAKKLQKIKKIYEMIISMIKIMIINNKNNALVMHTKSKNY